MDPIILLLAAQLLIISAILLTTSKSKMPNPLLAIKTLLGSQIDFESEAAKEEEQVDTDIDAPAQEEPSAAKDDGLVIAEQDQCASQKCDDERNTCNGRAKRKKKTNLKINELQRQVDPRRSDSICASAAENSLASILFGRSLKFTLAMQFIRWMAKLVVKRPFKGSSAKHSDLDSGKQAEPYPRVQLARPIESSYLVKIIAARKSEKIVRIKVARLNMSILKARGVRPLQIVPEMVEQDA